MKDFLQKKAKRFNTGELFNIASEDNAWARHHFDAYHTGFVMHTSAYGLHFERIVPNEHLLVKLHAQQESKSVNILALGHLSRDFGQFFRSI
ncbi:MAG: hypothetical protein CSA19_00275 [Deltaproteobacteria bacterium]|nr:MAG: hypothetical protein CSA19_00275 [Deltaproteobacteria bacterium]